MAGCTQYKLHVRQSWRQHASHRLNRDGNARICAFDGVGYSSKQCPYALGKRYEVELTGYLTTDTVCLEVVPERNGRSDRWPFRIGHSKQRTQPAIAA